jgi:hypothetical protein
MNNIGIASLAPEMPSSSVGAGARAYKKAADLIRPRFLDSSDPRRAKRIPRSEIRNNKAIPKYPKPNKFPREYPSAITINIGHP